jgi:periplasmic protein TonB
MSARAVFSAYEKAEQPGTGQVLPFHDRAGRACNERHRLLLSMMMALLLHVFALLLLVFIDPRPQFDEPPHVLSVVLLKAEQADPLASAPKPEMEAKPLHLHPEPRHAKPKQPPLLIANESSSPLLAVAQTVVDLPKTVTVPVHASPSAEEPEPVPPVPPSPVVSPRLDADYLTNPAMEYPQESRMRGEEGRVLLHVHVTENGRPDAVTLHRSSGFPRLDQAAVEAVWRWKFVPARQDGKAVAAAVVVPINFTLRR